MTHARRSGFGGFVAVVVTVAAVMTTAPSAAGASHRPRMRACGQVATRIPGPVRVLAIARVSVRHISCAKARGLARKWEREANDGKLPYGGNGKVNHGVLVYYRWGPPYHVAGYVCRSLDLPGPGPLQQQRTTCGSRAGLVTWHVSGRHG